MVGLWPLAQWQWRVTKLSSPPQQLLIPLSHFLWQLNLWRYGDFRADDADEFGYSR